MDKNIATILRDDTRTCMVSFQSTKAQTGWNEATQYMYVTTIPLAVGDVVLVPARDHMTVGCVTAVHDDLCIDPGDETYYKFVIAKVDMTRYQQDLARNREIEDALKQGHKARMRAQFKEQFLGANQNLALVLDGNA